MLQIRLSVYKHIEGSVLQYTRGGKHTHIPIMQTVQRYIFSFLLHHVKAQAFQTDKNHSRAFATVVNVHALRVDHGKGFLIDHHSVRFGNFIPKQEDFLINRFKQIGFNFKSSLKKRGILYYENINYRRSCRRSVSGCKTPQTG